MLKIKGPKLDPCGITVIMSYQELKQRPIYSLFTIIKIIKKNIWTYFIQTKHLYFSHK